MLGQFALALGLYFFIGCGGDEPSPVEKCDDLVDVLCDRAVECINVGTHSECVQMVQSALACGDVVEVTSKYDRCKEQMASFDCAILFPVDPETGERQLDNPADCEGVFLK